MWGINFMQNVNLLSIDLNLLSSLEILLEEGDLQKTSARLNISQPSMSRTFARLRNVFHDELLIRTPDGYIKTPRAEWLQNNLEKPLATLRKALEAPNYNPSLEKGCFKIGTLDYAEVVLIPTLWESMNSICSGVNLEIVQRSMYSAYEIQTLKADVSIGVMPKTGLNNCNFEPIFKDRYVCVMCKDHPLAKGDLTLKGYLAYGHSVFKTASIQTSVIDEALKLLGMKRVIKKQSPNFLAAHRTLSKTDILLTSVAKLAVKIAKSENLTIKELPFDLEPIMIYQIWHVKNNHVLRQQWLRKQIKLAANNLQPVDIFK